MTPEEFRAAGHDLIDWLADHIEGIEGQRVTPTVGPGDVRAQLPASPPLAAEPWSAVRADLDDVIVPGLVHWQHPGFFAYYPANVTYPSILAELASAGLGVQGMNWATGPACTEVETLMLDWMRELLGLPERFASTSATGGGVIHGSASEATLVAILAARWRSTGGAVNADGDTSRLVAYGTAQSHSSIEKGLRVAGLGTDRFRVVAHDEEYAMRPDALAAAIDADREAGLVPCIVVATVGSTSSMAIDPVADIGAICRDRGVWLHVDAAMTGIAALEPALRWIHDGLELADSYCTDAHKWMGVNFDCDLFWTADRTALLGALSILPEYLRTAAAEAGAVIDYTDWQVPLGRRFRALKLWFVLRLDGVDAIRAMIREQVEMTQRLAALAEADDRFEVVAPHPLNLLCLRLRSGDADTDALIDAANATGDVLLTRTVLDGRSALRFSIGTTTTRWHHVESAWHLLQSLTSAPLEG